MRKKIIFLCILCVSCFCAKNVFAGEVIAVVNDRVISDFDVENRMRMIILTSKMPNDEETIAQLRNQVITTLIDEKVKTVDAEANNIKISEDEINAGIARIEKQGRMQEGMFHRFLEMNDIAPTTIDNFVTADLSWFKLVSKKFSEDAKVTDVEVNAEIEKIKRTLGKNRNLLSEIFLAVKDEKEDEKIKQKAIRFYEELKEGADFSIFAKNFSESPNTKNDGSIGWVNEGTMEDVLEKTVKELSVDEVSFPIKGKYGYYIFKLQDRRSAFEGVNTLYSASRIVFDEDDMEKTIKTIKDFDKASCKAFNDYAYSLKDDSGEMVLSKFEDFPDEFQKHLSNIKPFGVSDYFEFEGKQNVLMLCGIEHKYPIPDREVIRQSLLSTRLEQMATRYLRDLKRNSVIKMKK